jgi:hypothetical protein
MERMNVVHQSLQKFNKTIGMSKEGKYVKAKSNIIKGEANPLGLII